MSLRAWWSHLRRCRHKWYGTRYNPWYIETEQTCKKCGAKRHHFIEDLRGIGEEPAWRDGAHPGERRSDET